MDHANIEMWIMQIHNSVNPPLLGSSAGVADSKEEPLNVPPCVDVRVEDKVILKGADLMVIKQVLKSAGTKLRYQI